jgi:hypothetical protein
LDNIYIFESKIVSAAGSSNVGGLVGKNELGSTVNDTYATGAVSDSGTGSTGSNVGGLVGDTAGSSIVNSYATGAVQAAGATAIGGLIGTQATTRSQIVSGIPKRPVKH